MLGNFSNASRTGCQSPSKTFVLATAHQVFAAVRGDRRRRRGHVLLVLLGVMIFISTMT